MKILQRIETDGVIWEDHQEMTLEQMQHQVGGLIEIVPCKTDGHVLVINEEGLLLNLPENPHATQMMLPEYLRAGNRIVGVALLAEEEE